MKKKIVSCMLVGAMALGLVACGLKGSNEGTAADTEGTTTSSNADDGEIFNLKMQIASFGEESPGLADVEEAINAITEPEIGVRVTLDPVVVWDLPSTSTLALTSNEEIDLMAIIPMTGGLDSVSNYTTKNMLLPLDDLYAEYGKDIPGVIGDLEKIGHVGDTLYAVPGNYYAGNGRSFVALTSELEELGFSFDENKVYTIEDVEKVMAAYKEKKGDGHYAIAAASTSDTAAMLCPTDDFGDPSVGSLMGAGLESTTIVNRFATDEYKAAYEKVREWYNAGYINPDATSITDSWSALLKTGQYLGAFSGSNSSGLDGMIMNEQNIGQDVTIIRYVDDFATTSSASYGLWAIPVTCSNPEKTMQFLNMLYQDRDLSKSVAALLSAGIEGKTYNIVETLDNGGTIVDYVDGLNRMTVPYAGALPIYGDELRTPKYTPIDAEMIDEMIHYNETLKYSKAFGYTFDSSEYASQISAISNVVQTYNPQLMCGVVDVDSVLPQFISELEAAGINDVIAGNQEQLDAWLAKQ